MFSLSGKTAFITGGTTGIGRAVAEWFIKAGAKVVVANITDDEAIATEIGASFVRMDVSDGEDQVAAGLAQAEELVGKLDTVINNAGVGDVGPTLVETDRALIEKVTKINLWGVLYGLKHAPKHMNDGGAIINTSSLAGTLCLAGAGIYSATKAAVENLTATAAVELGNRGIRVNAVAPSYVATALGSGEEGDKIAKSFTALGRLATVDDLAGVFHFLAAEESAYITGQTITVDGGWSKVVTPKLLETVTGVARASG